MPNVQESRDLNTGEFSLSDIFMPDIREKIAIDMRTVAIK